ncbi:MAG: lipoprotein, partial [Acutalibacteraceae bacterium]
MKKILSIFLILALLFSLVACGSKKTADVEVIRNDTGSSEQSEDAVIPLNLSTVDDFSNGFAWIFHKDINGAKTYSLIDTSGKIIYSNPNISYYGDMDTDACYIVEGDGDNRIYKIIDTNGNEVASSESGAFDSIEACGDNLFLVYKDKSDISSSRNALGIIDAKGNFVNELKESVFLNTDPRKTQTKYKHYLGSGMFAIAIKTYGANDYITYDYLIYSSQTKKTFYLNRINISNTQTSIKDTVYIYADNDSSIIYENSPDKSVSISNLSSKGLFSLSSNGVVQSANSFSS